MCGISCILSLQNCTHNLGQTNGATNGSRGHPVNGDTSHDMLAKEMENSLDMIQHRGPDARGQWISEDKRVGPLNTQLRLSCVKGNLLMR